MKNKIIPVFYCIPRSGGSYIQEWSDQICRDEYKEPSSIFILDDKQMPILKIKTTNGIKDKFVYLDFFEKEENLKTTDVFSIFVLSNGINKHSSLLRKVKKAYNIKTKSYIVLRDPLEREISFYNYWKSESSSHEKAKIKIEAKSFKEYVESCQMSDSWFIHQLTKSEILTEDDYKKACKLLDRFEVLSIQEIDRKMKKIFNLKNTKYHVNWTGRNATKEKDLSVSAETFKNFVLKKKYEYQLFEKYIANKKSKILFEENKKQIKKEDCYFNALIKIKNETIATGPWDFSECIEDYLGNLDFKNKRVLDVWSSSNYTQFYIESLGSDVVCLEPPNGLYVDYVKKEYGERPSKQSTKKNTNAFWYIKNKIDSKNNLFLWDLYKEAPPELGKFDISILSMNISRFRDPFLVLMNLGLITKSTIVIANEFIKSPRNVPFAVLSEDDLGTWWYPTINCINLMMEKIGFELEYYTTTKPKMNGFEKKYNSLVFKKRRL